MTHVDTLSIGGPSASATKRWTYAELAELPDAAQVADVGALAPGREGRGVRLSALLEHAGLRSDARHVHVASTDPAFAVSLPLREVAAAAIVLYDVGGKPLEAQRGGPFRLLVPGHPDECVNVKSLARLELAPEPGRDTRPQDDAEHAKLHAKKR